jgi:phosphohistidine phosphatase
MKTLTILRHAKSSWNDSSLSDHERPLNGRGKRDAPDIAERIRKAGIRPSLIISSPAKRAWSTAKVIAREISYPVEFLQREKSLYHAGLQILLDTLAQQDQGFNSILLVGHNPGLTDLANFLVPRLTDNIPTCGFVSVLVDREDWNFSTVEDARLIVYDYPKRID